MIWDKSLVVAFGVGVVVGSVFITDVDTAQLAKCHQSDMTYIPGDRPGIATAATSLPHLALPQSAAGDMPPPPGWD